MDIKTEIIRRMSAGESLRAICRDDGFPDPATIIKWTAADDVFAQQYAHARDERADVYFDRLDEVSEAAENAPDAVKVAGLRLKADNIKWQLARMAPKRYGDKLELGGALDLNSKIERITRRVVDTKPQADGTGA